MTCPSDKRQLYLPHRLYKTRQCALKRLNKGALAKQFFQEYETLCRTSKIHHANTIRVLSAFRLEDHNTGEIVYQFLFPLAIESLKQLLHGLIQDSYALNVFQSLWSRFKGLASALVYPHGKCNIIHGDIKASDILLFNEPSSRYLLRNFGLAINLQDTSTESSWAWQRIQPGGPD